MSVFIVCNLLYIPIVLQDLNSFYSILILKYMEIHVTSHVHDRATGQCMTVWASFVFHGEQLCDLELRINSDQKVDLSRF